MARLVMKFGGTSVANIERIRNVALHVKREVDAGNEVAVVVSAMSGKTNELVGWVTDASKFYDAREYDAVVASGEQVTSGLLALVLQEMGIPARSWQGWQIPIRTDERAWRGAHCGIDRRRLSHRQALRCEGQVAVIAGFQGIHAPDNPDRDARTWRFRHDRRWRSRPRSRPTAATSIPMSTGSTRPILASSPRRKRLDQDLLRGNARDGLARRQGAAGALR